MKALIIILCLIISTLAAAQQAPLFTVGADLQSATTKMSLFWENTSPSISQTIGRPSLGITPYAEIKVPLGPIFRYTYIPGFDERALLLSDTPFRLLGTEFEADKTVDFLASTQIHKWSLQWDTPQVSPLVTLEQWNVRMNAVSEDRTIESAMHRTVFGAGLSLDTPLTRFVGLHGDGAYFFTSATRGYSWNVSLGTRGDIGPFPAATKLGFAWQEMSFLDEVTKKFQVYGPEIKIELRFR